MAIQPSCIDFVITILLTGPNIWFNFAASLKFSIMKNETGISTLKNVDDEIQFYIKRKKDENSALKKLLTALENAKKNASTKSTT